MRDYTNQNAKEADMCEFCTQHGEGEKWYLTMENYSRELLDQHERRQYAAEFLNGFDKRVPKSIKQLDMVRRTPLMKLAKPILTHIRNKTTTDKSCRWKMWKESSTWCRELCVCRVFVGV